MDKKQVKEVKEFINEITGKDYTKTFLSKTETLHVRIGTYYDSSLRDPEATAWIDRKNDERDNIIRELRVAFPQYNVQRNNKRYQGFINDICITVN